MAMYTPQTRRRALNNLLEWAHEHAFRGTMDPDDWHRIDSVYLEAVNRVERLLELPPTKKLKLNL